MKKRKKVGPPGPEQWDFRGISKEELESAIEYEYLRENKSFVAEIEEWILKPFTSCQEPGVFERSGLVRNTVGRAFWSAQKLNADRRQEVEARIASECPYWPAKVFYLGLPFCGWKKLSVELKNSRCLRIPTWPFPGYDALSEVSISGDWRTLQKEMGVEPNSPLPMQLLRWEKPITYHAFRIDWTDNPTTIIRAFKKWIEGNKPTTFKPRQTRGRGTQTQNARYPTLKQLGAWRLKKSGLSYAEAQRVIDQTYPKDSANDPDYILPRYTDAAWDVATKKAETEYAAIVASIQRQRIS